MTALPSISRSRWHAAALLCTALALSGCGGETGPERGAPDAAVAEGVPAMAAPPVLAVDAEGLRLFDAATGSARALAFGMPAEQVIAALAPLSGAPERSENPECGGGPMEFAAWPDGVTLVLQDGAFRGWSLDERTKGAVTTASGIGPGSSRRELEAAYRIEVEESSLGTEFMAGEMSGLLDGTGPDARVVALWAGLACVFR